MKRLLLLVISLYSLTALGSTQAQAVSKDKSFDQQLSWSKTYLLNEIFRINYSSLYEQSQSSGADMASFWFEKSNVNSLKAAYLTAKLNKRMNDKNPLVPVFEAHINNITKKKNEKLNWDKFRKLSSAKSLSVVLDDVLEEFKLSSELGKTWKHSYVEANASCSLSELKKSSFISMQDMRVKNNLPITASNVITSIEKWNANEVLCLAIELSRYPIRGDEYKKYSPLPLLQTLDAISSSLMKDERLQVVYTTELFRRRHYAASLRVLYSLQNKEEAYKLPYLSIQRIYSMTEKGKGAVALQSL